MKKILSVAMVAAMIALPMTASAAPQTGAVQSQVSTNVASSVVSPDYFSKYVTVQQYYSKLQYPTASSVPSYYYYDQDTYSGWINRISVRDFGTQWYVTYSGYVTSPYY